MMEQGKKILLASCMIVLVFVSSFGAVNWISKYSMGWILETSSMLVYQAIFIYHITAAENGHWELAKKLIDNDNYSGAMIEVLAAENSLKSFVDSIQEAENDASRYGLKYSLLQNTEIYDNLIQLAQQLDNRIDFLVENLQTEELQQSFVNQLDNEFKNLSDLYFDIFTQEIYQSQKYCVSWLINNAGQISYKDYVGLTECVI